VATFFIHILSLPNSYIKQLLSDGFYMGAIESFGLIYVLFTSLYFDQEAFMHRALHVYVGLLDASGAVHCAERVRSAKAPIG